MNIEVGLNVNKSFKLLNLELFNHPLLGNISIDFADDNELNNGPYTTLILGPNGTGKSELLRIIVDIFRELEIFVASGNVSNIVKIKYRISYLLSGKKFVFSNKSSIQKKTNSNEPKNTPNLRLPKSLIAASILLNDKFPVISEGESQIYKYLGVRRTPGAAGTQSYIRRIIDLILNRIKDDTFLSSLKSLLEFLEYDISFEISFSPRYRSKIFTGELSPEYLKTFYLDWRKILIDRKTPPYGSAFFTDNYYKDSNFLLATTQKIDEITDLFNLTDKSNSIRLNIFSNNYNKQLISNLRILSAMDLLRTPEIKVTRKTKIGLQNLSSGEYHLLVSFIAIMSVISADSIILLDEPEISLHANWQIKYISFLKEIFRNYPSCHFIIASHSHFFVSDLLPETSYLNFLRKGESNKIECESIPYSTYGWSAENILYKVFNVRTVRNYYFEIDLRKLLNLISSNSQNRNEISELITKLESHTLDENDPLLQIISEAKLYLEQI